MSLVISSHFSKTWPNGIVPYEVFFKNQIKRLDALLEESIEHMHAISPIRFVPRNKEKDYVVLCFWDDPCDCSMKPRGCQSGKQYVDLHTRFTKTEVLHTFCHILGLEHEHRRQDRDETIKVVWKFIGASEQEFFSIAGPEFTMVGSYDLQSILQFDSYVFAVSQYLPSIVTRLAVYPPPESGIIRPNTDISPGDLAGLRFLYPSLAWD